MEIKGLFLYTVRRILRDKEKGNKGLFKSYLVCSFLSVAFSLCNSGLILVFRELHIHC